ncbi:MAG: CBS domain-containing protein [Solirubrobacteraceae bacterium]|nr:CBS domain-containing protein [Solirubrobacteraceae bacterium]
MMIVDRLLRDVPLLKVDDTVGDAAKWILASGAPALPVVKRDGRLHGIFGEREFIAAIFPGYVSELKFAGFVRQSLDDAIQRRSGKLLEPVGRFANRERIAVKEDYAVAQLAETFLHHRVLIVPVVDAGRQVRGIVTRSDFFATLVDRASPVPPPSDAG